jgi:hypothetical protein
MNENRETIVLPERAAEVGRLRDVLRAWGYGESEIKSFLTQQKADQKLDKRGVQNGRPERPSFSSYYD